MQAVLKEAKLNLQIIQISKNNIEIQTNLYDIHEFYIDSKSNGVEILIQTTKEFKEQNIATSINSSGWLNITILNIITN